MLPELKYKCWDEEWISLEEFVTGDISLIIFLEQFKFKRYVNDMGYMDRIKIKAKHFNFEHIYEYDTKCPDHNIRIFIEDLENTSKIKEREM